MNQQLTLLAEQAAQESSLLKNDLNLQVFVGDEQSYEVPGTFISKFAELIIEQCIRVPYDMWDKAELNADVALKIEYRIKDHFGVEE